jgi:flagellar basal-body rod protein FlgC
VIRVDAIDTAASGIAASLAQLSSAAHNIVNVQSAKGMDEAAFQGDRPVLTESPAGGVQVSGSAPVGTPEGVPVPDEAGGTVRMPDIDLGGEMVQMLLAQQSVAADVNVVHRAVDAYRDLLAMTNRDRAVLAAESF